MAVGKEKKSLVVKEFRQHPKDTGSCEVQVALLTTRINDLTEHVKTQKKDRHSRRGLVQMVEARRKLLAYLEREDEERYQKLISKLKIRK